MKKIASIIYIFATTIFYVNAQNAKEKDDIFFSKAQTALAKKDCKTALALLSMISIDGKDRSTYYQLMAEMQECMGNPEQAAFFYKKSQSSGITDTVQARINALELTAEKRASYNEHKYDYTPPRRNFSCFNAAFIKCTGGEYVTFRKGWELTFNHGIPIIKKHAIVEYNFHAACLTSPNIDWYSRALNAVPNSVKSVNPCLVLGVSSSVLAMAYKNNKMSIAVGPALGVRLMMTMGASYTSKTDVRNDDNNTFGTATWGVKARYYYNHKFTAFIAYDKLTRKKIDVDLFWPDSYDVPLKMGLLSVGIGIFTSFRQ